MGNWLALGVAVGLNNEKGSSVGPELVGVGLLDGQAVLDNEPGFAVGSMMTTALGGTVV